MSTDYNKRRLSESAHRITISLDGVEAVTVTLPHPIDPITIKATLFRCDGIIDIVAEKALRDVWPEDDIELGRSRWNAEKLGPWSDQFDLHDSLLILTTSQYPLWYMKKLMMGDSAPVDGTAGEMDNMARLGQILAYIFIRALEKDHQFRFQLKLDVAGSSEDSDWYVRAHLPIRTSPSGTPILLLSAVDQRLSERLQREGKLNKDRAKKDLHRIYGHVSEEERIVIHIPTLEVARLLRYILRLISTKIRPMEWQKENLPQGKPMSPCLSTFIGFLYRDCIVNEMHSFEPPPFEIGYCFKCWEKSKHLKRCGRCKSVSYCSVSWTTGLPTSSHVSSSKKAIHFLEEGETIHSD